MSQKRAPPAPEQIVAVASLVVGAGQGGSTHMLARVSVVDYRGQVLYDQFVQPTIAVTDYRTAQTGIEARHLAADRARPFSVVQQEVGTLLRGKVVVGHSLWQDLSVLGLPHPASATRDVALYQPFRNALRATQAVGLPTLMWQLMRRRVQEGQVSSLENARATMDLYRSHAAEWEGAVAAEHWPSHLPPSTFSRCYQ